MVVSFIAVILWAVSLMGLFVAAVSDFKYRIIPNPLVALVAGCGGVLRLLSQPQTIAISIASAGVILLVLGFPARWAWIGGGDAKLITAVTFLVPPDQILALWVFIAIVGGLLSCCYLFAHLALRRYAFTGVTGNQRRHRLHRREGWFYAEAKRIIQQKSVPYGLAVFGGTLCFVLIKSVQCFYATH